MNVITYSSLLISALFISLSFIIQIKCFEGIQSDWTDYVGLDNFNTDNPNFEESKINLHVC